jgi:hypothetical protein
VAPLAWIAPFVVTGLLTASTAMAAAQPSGLHGTVTKGPIAPVCRVDQRCDAPVEVTLRFTRPSTTRSPVYTVRSKSSGIYRIALPSGVYAVSVSERIGIDHLVRPRTVRVRSGHVDAIDFFIDTGLR